MQGFKKFTGEKIADLGQYARDYVKNNPEVVIYVGCDSQQLRRQTVYATVVCFVHPHKGAHVIYKKDMISKVRDLFTRLWNELEYSKQVGEYFNKELAGYYKRRYTKNEYESAIGRRCTEAELEKVNQQFEVENLVDIDIDINKSKRHASNRVYDSGIGYLRGCGFRVRAKPDAYAATCAADLLCK